MDAFWSEFLAKNKYPKICEGVSTNGMKIPEELANKDDEKEIKTEQEIFNLSLGYLFEGDLEKAKNLAEQNVKDLNSLTILLIIYLLNDKKTNYHDFRNQFDDLIGKLAEIEELYENGEQVYRFLRLLSGWALNHQEYEFGQDTHQLSEWVDEDEIDYYEVDSMMNRWLTWSLKKELILFKMVFGDENEKLNYHLS